MLDGGAAAEIAGRYALGGALALSERPVAKGKQGNIWRLDTDRGSWAIKEPFFRTEEADIAASARLQGLAAAAGVPTPQVIRTQDGAVLADIGDAQVRTYEWVDLLGPDIMLDPVAVGSAVAAVHRVRTIEGDPLDAWYSEPIGAARWDAVIAELTAARAPFADQLAEVRDELIALETWMEAPGPLQACHRDLWADNLLPTVPGAEQGSVGDDSRVDVRPNVGGVCLIDWENSGLADPSQELGCVLFEFGSGRPDRAKLLYEAYLDNGGPGRVQRPGHFTMLIAQLGHIGETACRDWLVPNRRSPHRSDSAAWFAEFIDRPHHRVVLQEILDAIS